MSVMVYKGRLMGIGDYLRESRHEAWQIAEGQRSAIAALRTRLKRLDHAIVFLRGGGELSPEQRTFVAGEVGEKLANAKTNKERTKLLAKLQKAREFVAGLRKEAIQAHNDFSERLC